MSGVVHHSKSIEQQLKQLKNQTISADIFSFEEPGGLSPIRRTKLKQSDWSSNTRQDQEDVSGIIQEDVDFRETPLENGAGEAKPETIFPEELINLVHESGTAIMKSPFYDDNNDNSDVSKNPEQEEPLSPEQIRRQHLNDKFSKGIVLVVLGTATLGIVGAGFGIARALLKRNHTRTMIL